MEREVSVIIPTYKRAHLLPKTIPSYIQAGVGEVILVDDASGDDTRQVVTSLQRTYPLIKYIPLRENRKQAFAKNRGIMAANFPFIYFGDDDSVLMENSIQLLLQDAKRLKADIVGAKALYMESLSDMEDISGYVLKNNKYISNVKELIDMENFKVDFALSCEYAIKVPFTQASFLIKTELAKKILFDETYLGNAYREETDFLLRANREAANIYYQSKAVQVNLPRSLSHGGAHSGGRVWWYFFAIKNNWKFLKKHHAFVKQKYNLKSNIYFLQLQFSAAFISNGFINFSKHMYNIVRKFW